MHRNDTPNTKKVSLDDSIRLPSVPRDFIERWNKNPAESFNLLPVVETGNRDNAGVYGNYYGMKDSLNPSTDYTLAPVVLVDGDDGEKRWQTVRCPVCAGRHRYHADNFRERPDTITWYTMHGVPMFPREQFLGQHKSHRCWADGHAEPRWIWLVGIDREPSDIELDKYFPTKVKPKLFAPIRAPRIRNTTRQTQGGVYLVKAAGRFKIGISSNPSARVASLATASPYPVETVHIEYTDDYQVRERRLHRQFAEFRTHLEWFEFPDEMIPQVIEAIRAEVI